MVHTYQDQISSVVEQDKMKKMSEFVPPEFGISIGRCLLSWQKNCYICVEYEKQDRKKERLTAHCYNVKVSVLNAECSGPKLECSLTDIALLRLALSNLTCGGSGGGTSFQTVMESEPEESEPESGSLNLNEYFSMTSRILLM